jgi:tRNA A37 threonylcarbamoyladenosine synthetase subunit TsaC/SUA5/YrdC
VDYILDAGPTYHSADSTIVNFTTDPPEVIREGAMSQSDIMSMLEAATKK